VRIERASPTDLTQLASDVGPAPMNVGALLLLDAGTVVGEQSPEQVIAERSRRIPRLHQRLTPVPFGCGRPIWVDDPDFDVRRHVRTVTCPPPGDEAALLAVAAQLITDPLPRSRPLWAAVVVRGLDRDRVAVVVVLHHVLADGIGGLAVLGGLVDGADPARPAGASRRRPATTRLAADALGQRVSALLLAPRRLRPLGRALGELGVGRPRPAPRCSLNQPTGPERRLAVVRADLATVRAVAHQHGGTVNDVVLTAVTGSLHSLLAHRGERVESLVVSVPVSARRSATIARLGNQVGVMPLTVGTVGSPTDRLAATIALTQARKSEAPGSSGAVLGPVFRLLGALGLFRWFIERQRLVNTFVTNLPGPPVRMALAGASVTEVIPVSVSPGNVTASFAVLSYAGTLAITVIADPVRVRDLPVLVRALDDELARLTA